MKNEVNPLHGSLFIKGQIRRKWRKIKKNYLIKCKFHPPSNSNISDPFNYRPLEIQKILVLELIKLFKKKQVNPLHGSLFIKGQSRSKKAKNKKKLFNKVQIPPSIKLQ